MSEIIIDDATFNLLELVKNYDKGTSSLLIKCDEINPKELLEFVKSEYDYENDAEIKSFVREIRRGQLLRSQLKRTKAGISNQKLVKVKLVKDVKIKGLKKIAVKGQIVEKVYGIKKVKVKGQKENLSKSTIKLRGKSLKRNVNHPENNASSIKRTESSIID
jgi:hypothetical protein